MLKVRNFFRFPKKNEYNSKKSLWRNIQRVKRPIKTLGNKTISSTLFAESYKAISYPLETTSYPITNPFELAYVIAYLHHHTNILDRCLQAMQKNPILTSAFQLSYNEFRAKFYNLLVISADQGENFSLALSKQAEFFSTLTHFFELLPPPFSALGGVIRFGISEISKRHKVYDSKSLLNYCITDENFTKIVSLLFSCILVKNLSETEDLDLSVKKNFSIFWEILKEKADQFGNKANFTEKIEKIWAYCFCFFELTLSINSKQNISKSILNSDQKKISKMINQFQLSGSIFFDLKKSPSVSSLTMRPLARNNIGIFWNDMTDAKTIFSKPEMSLIPALPT